MGRHRGAKDRSIEADLDQRWKRLQSGGKLDEIFGPSATWRDPGPLIFAALTYIYPTMYTLSLKKGEVLSLFELTVASCELSPAAASLADLEMFVRALPDAPFDPEVRARFIERLRKTCPDLFGT